MKALEGGHVGRKKQSESGIYSEGNPNDTKALGLNN